MVTETAVRTLANSQSFSRGRDYYESGYVVSLLKRGNMLYGEVEGSQYEPYQVQVTLDNGEIAETACDCPYDWGGICKHIVAALLQFIHDSDSVEERPSPETLLTGLNADQLRAILLQFVNQVPDLIRIIEDQVSTPEASSTGSSSRSALSTVNADAFRHRVRGILHSLDRMRPSEAYWHVDGVVRQLGEIVKETYVALEDGNGRNALIEHYPEWAMIQAKAQAESIMDRGQSKNYYRAVEWLRKTRAAYIAAEKEAEWHVYLDSLLVKHGRKYSLVPQLKAIR